MIFLLKKAMREGVIHIEIELLMNTSKSSAPTKVDIGYTSKDMQMTAAAELCYFFIRGVMHVLDKYPTGLMECHFSAFY